MNRTIVRNFKSNATHYADLGENQTVPAVAFGASYTAPVAGTRTLCNVALTDGVVMRPTVDVKCKTCRMLADHIQDVEDGQDPMELREQVVRDVLREQLAFALSDTVLGHVGDVIMSRLREIE